MTRVYNSLAPSVDQELRGAHDGVGAGPKLD